MSKRLVQRWQSRGGKYWYELYQDERGFTYTGDNCGGNLGNITEGEARDHMNKLVATCGPILRPV